MTDLLSDVETPSDAELISRVRGGDVAAYGDLFSRHVDAANRLARQLVRGPDCDDLVSEAFAKVLHVLQGGGGPDVAFRAYLLTAVRRLHVDKVRAASRLQTTDDLTPFDPGVPFQDTAVAGFESGAAAKAFGSLPERWQLVLWHLEVEGQKPADIAPLLGMSANSVSALAYRAREGLRQAFLTMHLSDISDTDCRWVNEHLGAYVRKGLSKRDTTKVQAHLDGCRRCTAMYLELTDVNSNLSGIIAPLLLGAAATGYLASSGTTGVAGVLALVGKAKEVVAANSGVATAGAVAAGVAAVAVAGIAFSHGRGDRVLDAERPLTASTPAAPAASAPGTPSSETTTRAKQQKTVKSPSMASTTPPAAVLPTFVPTPTASADITTVPAADQPGTVPGDQPGSDPGGQPGTGGPGQDPGGPSTDPSGHPTDKPTDKPTDDPGGQPVDVETNLRFDVGPVATVGGNLHLELSGDVLPPTVKIGLGGDVAGLGLAGDLDERCTVDGLTVTCSTPSGLGSGLRALPARAALAKHFAVDLPVSADDPYANRSLTTTVSVPTGFSVGGEQSFTVPVAFQPRRDFDFHLSDLVVGGDDDGDRTYALQTRVAGVPAVVDQLSLDVAVPAGTRVDPAADGATCSWHEPTRQVMCGHLPGPGESFGLQLAIALPDTTSQDVAVALVVPSGWTDSSPGDTRAMRTLDPVDPLPVTDAWVTATSDLNGQSGKGTIEVTVGVRGGQAVPVQLTTLFDPDMLVVTGPKACPVDDTNSCTIDADALGKPLTFAVQLVDRTGSDRTSTDITFAVAVPGYDESDDHDNRVAVEVAKDRGTTGGAAADGAGSGVKGSAPLIGSRERW